MARYILNRVLSGIITLFLFVTLLFFLANAVIPGDFVTSMGPMSAQDAAAARAALGLDQPLVVQYWDWLTGALNLDLGDSFAAGPVWDTLKAAMAPTLVVLSLGLLVAFTLGGWLGRTAGYGGGSLATGSATIVAIVCLTIFPPALAVAMEQTVNNFTGWSGLGVVGTLEDWSGVDGTPDGVLWRMFIVFTITAVTLWLIELAVFRIWRRRIPRWVFMIAMTILPLTVWAQMGVINQVIDLAGTMSLLIAAVVLLTFGEVLLVTKAAMDDVMMEDYVMVARAKGLPERQVRDKHAARIALLPVISRFAVAIPYFLTGLVILEISFGGTAGLPITGTLMRFDPPPGLGSVLFNSLSNQDTPMLIGALAVVGVLTLFLRIVLDVVYAALDPRIRFSGAANGQ